MSAKEVILILQEQIDQNNEVIFAEDVDSWGETILIANIEALEMAMNYIKGEEDV